MGVVRGVGRSAVLARSWKVRGRSRCGDRWAARLPGRDVQRSSGEGWVATDPDVVERGTRSHARLQNRLAADVASSGLVPLSPAAGDPPFDLAWRDGADLHVAEVNSTTAMNEEHQMRLGLEQLLRYRHALSAGGTTVHATLYVDRRLVDPRRSELCQSLGVTLRWPTP